MGFLLIMAIPLALMWFMASRTQKREEKRKQELLSAVKRGDQVVTIGGAHGEVASVGESTVDVRLGKGDDAAIVTFNKTAIASVAGIEAGKAK
jgi:preprotein translocase subunit YajC